MIGIGTIVNAIAIILGGAFGLFIKKGLPDRIKHTVMQAVGLSVFVLGASGAMQGILAVTEKGLSRIHIMLMILSMVIGGIIGAWIDIEDKLEQFGKWCERRLHRLQGNFAEGFITTTLIYCVGAMAIVGALEDGLSANPSTLYAKSILDGVSAIIFSATMGVGVCFSAVTVFLYQGTITFAAGAIKPFLTPQAISEMSLIGSILIMSIGINLLEIGRIKVGNLLPAIFVPLVYETLHLLGVIPW